MKTLLISLLVLFSCSARPAAVTATRGQLMIVHSTPRMDSGDASSGRQLFTKLRCDICHSVAGTPGRAPHPLPDLTAQPPNAIAALIVQRGETPQDATFVSEMAVSGGASEITPQELADIVAYLRQR